ncbi:chitin synthase CHS3 NDAI_0A07240 [Naumovozyma dairenensis CBS 421]|uniref:chitin synthase n=1 Tax=Naumovozyma dairenensis (strain ATCC 10597 / BCRC 20456 / CBS 421 / NBRC 0211 / NRRL Y-12639) TaxID=1071378 RepID=G0W4Z0_NAUDC|nr:hypothetical protein NDAI_0A07240 [Naumovozyma dairenensis CBS 421]CCD22878.1 hypothetical protein NDAI_0A07240 [Naumovozyma dairenensis CBS 421]
MLEPQNDDDYYLNVPHDEESLLRSRSSVGSNAAPHRQGSLVRPERNRFDNPENPHYYYVQKTQQQKDHLSVLPSTTGLNPTLNRTRGSIRSQSQKSSHFHDNVNADEEFPLNDFSSRGTNRSTDKEIGKGDVRILDQDEVDAEEADEDDGFMVNNAPRKKTLRRELDTSLTPWQLYCYLLTFWIPTPLMRMCGMPKKERQMAWREKIALISVIFYIGAIVAYITFGFTKTVCGDQKLRLRNNEISASYITINGKAYELDATGRADGTDLEAGEKKIYGPWTAAGKDASFLYQNVNGNCLDIIVPKEDSIIPHDEENKLAWYFPCRLINQDGSSKPNFTTINYPGWGCHTTEDERKAYYNMQSVADVYFSWDDIKNSSRNLAVFNGHVLDLDLLNWLEKDQVDYPPLFDDLSSFNLQGYDLSLILSNGHERKIGRCLSEIIKVGEVDSKTVGCIASDVVLYVSLVFILSVVIIKFLFACYFRWTVARKQGAYAVDNKTMDKHLNDVEDWSGNIKTQGPIKQVEPNMRPIKHQENIKKAHKRSSTFDIFKKQSSKMLQMNESIVDLNSNYGETNSSDPSNVMTTMTTQNASRLFNKENSAQKSHSTNPSAVFRPPSMLWNNTTSSPTPGASAVQSLDTSIIHPDIVQQPPIDYKPFGFPLIHTICFVTCYSEDEEGLRTTLDSLSTTDYPNSHKLLMVVCDGLIKGSGNDLSTPEITLGMMEDFVTEPEDVKPYSYVAVASGTKRHNMAKIYAGFYKFNDNTVPIEKQQRVPMITIVKCGTPAEQGSPKPGNRGKRDSQVILMSFLQKVTFDERMTELEFQLLRNIWSLTGLMSDFYETVLMVDADTKVFPDSLTHMVAEMVKDPTVMGLCGETKIANKAESWVTAIQVFEYYISHHQSKAFESIFGSVTCLPGCFSLYRIKSPKGLDGYWVPVLANPDIVERYSDNVTDTLHKKNLLLLGEDRYLSSLMLKTFPKRKQIFVPKAACKTIVPDSFKVLLSQRRRWINSTVHNLFELVLLNDLCGTFCFSMQFVIGIELIGTLVLPLAICFTIYVIIFAIVSKPTPIITLVLLAVILGLPGLIVVITATRWSYLMWMAIYIVALPIWNFVLPSYAYWKFDDFSWGDTRTIAGGNKAGGHDDVEGEFDHSMIKMRTWREFEREERMSKNENGNYSVDNVFLT